MPMGIHRLLYSALGYWRISNTTVATSSTPNVINSQAMRSVVCPAVVAITAPDATTKGPLFSIGKYLTSFSPYDSPLSDCASAPRTPRVRGSAGLTARPMRSPPRSSSLAQRYAMHCPSAAKFLMSFPTILEKSGTSLGAPLRLATAAAAADLLAADREAAAGWSAAPSAATGGCARADRGQRGA